MGSPVQPPPRPFLKWLGGKRELLPELLQAVESAGEFEHYYEPFLGGGALFFALLRAGKLRHGSSLSDVNKNLIGAYLGVRDEVDSVIERLLRHKEQHCEEYFYRVRREVPDDLAGRAARIIYLNRTCFNGLYRENSRGEFNVPFGRYKNPLICDEENLRAVAAAFTDSRITTQPFAQIAARAAPGDLIYFDPPYAPASKTADFTAYSQGGFGDAEHVELASVFAALAGRGVKVILSNSLTQATAQLYKEFFIYKVYASRSVNSKGDGRGKVPEVIVTSFPLGGMHEHQQLRGSANTMNDSHGELEKTLARQWLLENEYGDVAGLIDTLTAAWKAQGKSTRRNWWMVLAGGAGGKPRKIGGTEFPVLKAAQMRQGMPVTDNAICRNPLEEAPPIRVSARWSAN